MEWLTEELQEKVRTVFEPRYKRKLSRDEVAEIAENLSGVIEIILKCNMKNKENECNKLQH
jgi:hypothetical protein